MALRPSGSFLSPMVIATSRIVFRSRLTIRQGKKKHTDFGLATESFHSPAGGAQGTGRWLRTGRCASAEWCRPRRDSADARVCGFGLCAVSRVGKEIFCRKIGVDTQEAF